MATKTEKKLAAAEKANKQKNQKLRAAREKLDMVQAQAAAIIGEERAAMAFTPLFTAAGGLGAGLMEGAGLAIEIPEAVPVLGGVEVSAGLLPGVVALGLGIYQEERVLVEVGSGATAYVAGSIGRQVAESILG